MSSLFKRPDSPYWWVRSSGDSRKPTIWRHSPSDKAERKENKRLAQAYARHLDQTEFERVELGDHTSISFAEAANEYLTAHAHEPTWGKEEKAVIAWLVPIPTATNPQEGSPNLGVWSLKAVANWDALVALRKLQDARGCTPNRTNRVLSVVSAVIHHNPQRFPQRVRIPLHEIKKRERPYVGAERIPQVCASLPWHLALAVNFAVATLLRMSSMLSLRWEDIFPAHRWAVVRPEFMKGNKPFGFALTDGLLAMLVKLREHQEAQWNEFQAVTDKAYGKRKEARQRKLKAWDRVHVFTWYGQKIGNCNTAAFQRAVRAAGFPAGFTWHSWRHVGATLARLSGISLPDLQALGAWESIASVQRYAHINPQTMLPAASKLAALLPNIVDIERMRRASGDGMPGGPYAPPSPLPVSPWGSAAAGSLGRHELNAPNAPPPPSNAGVEGDRTPDLVVANDTLSQLSYHPVGSNRLPAIGVGGTRTTHENSTLGGLAPTPKSADFLLALNGLAAGQGGESDALRTRPRTAPKPKTTKENSELQDALKASSGRQRPRKAANGA